MCRTFQGEVSFCSGTLAYASPTNRTIIPVAKDCAFLIGFITKISDTSVRLLDIIFTTTKLFKCSCHVIDCIKNCRQWISKWFMQIYVLPPWHVQGTPAVSASSLNWRAVCYWVMFFLSQTLHRETSSQVNLHVSPDLFAAEVNMMGFLQDHVELADLLRHLSAPEELESTNISAADTAQLKTSGTSRYETATNIQTSGPRENIYQVSVRIGTKCTTQLDVCVCKVTDLTEKLCKILGGEAHDWKNTWKFGRNVVCNGGLTQWLIVVYTARQEEKTSPWKWKRYFLPKRW